jgi:hypothetical protein
MQTSFFLSRALFRTKYFAGLALAAIAALAYAAGLEGALTGTVTQSDNQATYPVEMKLAGETGSVDYPSLHCGGKLALLRVQGQVYWYRENITYGKNLCYDGGMIGLARAESSELEAWNWRWEGFGVTAHGVLRGRVK